MCVCQVLHKLLDGCPSDSEWDCHSIPYHTIPFGFDLGPGLMVRVLKVDVMMLLDCSLVCASPSFSAAGFTVLIPGFIFNFNVVVMRV